MRDELLSAVKDGRCPERLVERAGREDRSRRDCWVVSQLVAIGFDADQIVAVFDREEVGDKYREEVKRGRGGRYVDRLLSKVARGRELPLSLRELVNRENASGRKVE